MDDAAVNRVRKICLATITAIRIAGLAVLAGIPAAALALPAVDDVRILTYNTAFMHVQADLAGPPPSAVPCISSCNPLEPPAPVPCTCPSLSIQLNRYKFADIEEQSRAEKIADRILATDQDVVVLNEVFDPAARTVFEKKLGIHGPYKHYVARLRGKAPVSFSSLLDVLDLVSGSPPFLADLSDFLLPYHPLNNDSGLMFFSKYPLLPLTGSWTPNDALCNSPECEFAGSNNGSPVAANEVVFKVYDKCDGVDCLASKGVGLVKVDTPRGPAYIAFTHLQADYDSSNWSSRQSQYKEVAKVIKGAIPPQELEGAMVYLAGDLNTHGSTRVAPQGGDGQEWHHLFDPTSASPNLEKGFFACGNGVSAVPATQPCRFNINGSRFLTDGWGFETSPTDRGNDGARLDYILHSSAQGRLCMQHLMYAWDLQADPYNDGGLVWLSDHFPVRGDFGLKARYCSANDDHASAMPEKNVHSLSFGPTNCAASGSNPPCKQNENISPPEAGIGPAGAFQWFRITVAGTYSIKVEHAPNAGVSYAVYHHSDLSRPVPPFEEEETRRGTIYSLPDPPYYIRTFAVDGHGVPDRKARSRDYVLKVHQHLCRKPVDACVLEPGLALSAPYRYQWPTTSPGDVLTELRELYWRFKTSGVKGGHARAGTGNGIAFPTVRMQIEASAGEPYTCMTSTPPVVEEWNDGINPTHLVHTYPFVDILVDTDHDWENDGVRDDIRVAPDLPGMADDKLAVFFLKLTRDSDYNNGFNVCNNGMTSWVSFHTNLTYFVPTIVNVFAQLDDDVGADDNMRIHMGFDSAGFQASPSAATSVDLKFDDPDQAYLHGYSQLQGYYVSGLWPTFWEQDEEEYLHAWAPYSPFSGISTLSTWDRSSSGGMQQFSDGGNPDSADYYYILHYIMCHQGNVPDCANPNVSPP